MLGLRLGARFASASRREGEAPPRREARGPGAGGPAAAAGEDRLSRLLGGGDRARRRWWWSRPRRRRRGGRAAATPRGRGCRKGGWCSSSSDPDLRGRLSPLLLARRRHPRRRHPLRAPAAGPQPAARAAVAPLLRQGEGGVGGSGGRRRGAERGGGARVERRDLPDVYRGERIGRGGRGERGRTREKRGRIVSFAGEEKKTLVLPVVGG